MDIHVLHKQGFGIRAIARKLGLSKNTVRRYLRQPIAVPNYSRAARPTKLEPFKPYLLQRIEAAKPHWIPAAVLFREIKALGYSGGETLVRAYVSQQKPKCTEVATRFETAPGVQLQADFTTIRRGRHALKAFVATLGFSRASFVRFTASETQEDWLEGIALALSYFGGIFATSRVGADCRSGQRTHRPLARGGGSSARTWHHQSQTRCATGRGASSLYASTSAVTICRHNSVEWTGSVTDSV